VNRRAFLACAAAGALTARSAPGSLIAAVRGPVAASQLGITLVHEHILVDFAGADQADPGRYNTGDVIRAALPKLEALRMAGCRTFVDCTPAYLGRDPALLRRLSESSGLNILTNTGYYGANQGKYLPKHAREETAEQLAERWTAEWRQGIDGTGVKPAFLKIGVNAGKLSAMDRKLIVAAATCHATTRLRIHVHTGDGEAAMDILAALSERAVPASEYVWVHAQNEKDRAVHRKAAAAGAWVEFDDINENTTADNAAAVKEMIAAGFLDRLLISQDSGWYHVGEPNGGDFRGYTYLFEKFLPALRDLGITQAQIDRLMVANPARVLSPGAPPAPPRARR